MKENIHPEYKTIKVKCSCGNEFETRSTPFFTGKQKIVDTGGRVEKFNKHFAIFTKKK